MRMTRMMRFVRKSVLCVDAPEPRSPRELARAARDIVLVSRFYYLFVAYMIGTSSLQFDRAYSGGPPTAPLWPIKLAQQLYSGTWLSWGTEITVVGLLFAIGAAAAPRMRVWRFGVCLYLLAHIGLANSYGSINHGAHVLLFVSVTLLFLPRIPSGGSMTPRAVLSCLTALSLTHVVLLLPYTLSGVSKLWHSGFEVFAPDAMVRILLERLLAEADDVPILLPVVAEHSVLGQAMWSATLYVELFALLVVFRPHLHRTFGALLMMFHVTSNWLMNISFSRHVLLLGLFLVLSPVAPAKFSLAAVVRNLPIVGIPVRTWSRLRSSGQRPQASHVALVYDGECPICSNYAQYLRLKQSVKEFTLVDARQGGPLVEEIRNLPHDLNDAMVAKIGNRFYIGHEALEVLALLSDSRGIFSRINRLAFSSPLLARLSYPWLKLGRRLLLKLKGASPIQAHNEARAQDGR